MHYRSATKASPTIIIAPGGDAILASEIKHVLVNRAHTSGGIDWPSRVCINSREYPCANDEEAETERDRIVAEWRASFGIASAKRLN